MGDACSKSSDNNNENSGINVDEVNAMIKEFSNDTAFVTLGNEIVKIATSNSNSSNSSNSSANKQNLQNKYNRFCIEYYRNKLKSLLITIDVNINATDGVTGIIATDDAVITANSAVNSLRSSIINDITNYYEITDTYNTTSIKSKWYQFDNSTSYYYSDNERKEVADKYANFSLQIQKYKLQYYNAIVDYYKNIYGTNSDNFIITGDTSTIPLTELQELLRNYLSSSSYNSANSSRNSANSSGNSSGNSANSSVNGESNAETTTNNNEIASLQEALNYAENTVKQIRNYAEEIQQALIGNGVSGATATVVSRSKISNDDASENPYAIRTYDIPQFVNFKETNKDTYGTTLEELNVVTGINEGKTGKIDSKYLYEALLQNTQSPIDTLNCETLIIGDDKETFAKNITKRIKRKHHVNNNL